MEDESFLLPPKREGGSGGGADDGADLLPALLSAIADPATAPSQRSSLTGLLSTVMSARQVAAPAPAVQGGVASPAPAVQGGVDFTTATRTADGRLCVVKEETVETLQKDPVLECKHNQEKQ